jgi:hypothetical protein
MRKLARTFGISRQTRVLDVGGTSDLWLMVPRETRPRVTLLNLDDRPSDLPEEFAYVKGSALALPFQPGEFDLVFSNSVIEHVGTWADQRRCAEEIRRLGCPYFVQTPDRYSPVEPHYMGIGVHLLPGPLTRPAAKYLTLWGLSRPRTERQVEAFMNHIRLLTYKQMAQLFPDAFVERTHVFGLPKEIIATRRHAGVA